MGQKVSSPDAAPQRKNEHQAFDKHLSDIEGECNKWLKTISNIRKELWPIQEKRTYVDSVLKETMKRFGLHISSHQPDNRPNQPVKVGGRPTPQGQQRQPKGNDTDGQMALLLQQKHDLQKALNDVNQDMVRRQREKDGMVKYTEQRFSEIESENVMLKRNLDETTNKYQKAKKEKEDALVRLRDMIIKTPKSSSLALVDEYMAWCITEFIKLSKLISKRLHENNPDIADLSDANRPTKLGEVYSELYDNEWTDAFDALTKAGFTEEYAIETLRLTLMNCWAFSKDFSTQMLQMEALRKLFGRIKNDQRQFAMTTNRKPAVSDQSIGMSSLEEVFKLHARWKPKRPSSEPPPSDLRMMTTIGPMDLDLKLQNLRKEVAASWVPFVQKAYLNSILDPSGLLPEMTPFIKKCLFLTWMMVVQTPPMWLDSDDTSGKPFDGKCYKEFMKRGPRVKFVVWPAVRLHEQGPLVAKGIAQGMDG